jgi:hypothetical protein
MSSEQNVYSEPSAFHHTKNITEHSTGKATHMNWYVVKLQTQEVQDENFVWRLPITARRKGPPNTHINYWPLDRIISQGYLTMCRTQMSVFIRANDTNEGQGTSFKCKIFVTNCFYQLHSP